MTPEAEGRVMDFEDARGRGPQAKGLRQPTEFRKGKARVRVDLLGHASFLDPRIFFRLVFENLNDLLL